MSVSFIAENRLTSVSGAATASFVYDGDGKRVQGTVNGVTTSYIGDYFEWSPSAENLVANPGFETTGNWTETTITGFASTWFYRSTWGTADQHSGEYGYVISNQMYGYLRSQEIAVSPGQYYDVNAYMRGLIDPEDSFGSVLVRAAFYTSGGAAVSNVDAATVSPGSLTTTWQKSGGVVTKYYLAGGTRVAMRKGSAFYWLLSDHPSPGSGQTLARPAKSPMPLERCTASSSTVPGENRATPAEPYQPATLTPGRVRGSD